MYKFTFTSRLCVICRLNIFCYTLAPHPHSAFTSSEQQDHVSVLEEKLHSLRSSLQELQLHGSQQKQTISELQLKNNQQNIETESLKRRIDELNQVWKQLSAKLGAWLHFR